MIGRVLRMLLALVLVAVLAFLFVERRALYRTTHRDPLGEATHGDRSNHRVGRRVDHRYVVGVAVHDVGVLRDARLAAEKAGNGEGREREHPANVKIHGIFPNSGIKVLR